MPNEKTLKGLVFTINNPPEDFDLWDDNRMEYLVYQKERGENGTLHIQGYLELKKRTRFSTVKKLLGDRAHLEPRRGTSTQARDYCMKEDTRVSGPWEFGEFKEISQGQRNDLLSLADAAKLGKRSREVFEEMPEIYLRHYRAFEHARSLIRPQRRDRRVILIIGPPGSGKTRYVLEQFPDVYQTPIDPRGFWFDGYEGQDQVLIDDYSGQWPLKSLLRLLHEYPERVPVKGGFTWWNPSLICITTNEPWQQWYNRDDQHRENYLSALGRRFTEVLVFPREPQ